jgi:PAS domain S-box-containing protein
VLHHYESGPDAMLAVDQQGIIRRANGFALALLGYSPGELVGSPLDCVLPDRFRESHRVHVERYFHNPYARHLPLGANLVARRRDGREIGVDISIVPLETPEGTLALAVLRPHSPPEEEKALRERLDFESLITDVTAHVVVATPGDIDRALLQALDRLRTAVQVDRAVLLEYAEDWSAALLTHVSYGDGVPPIPEKVDVRNLFPWCDRRLQSGETVFIPDVAALPPEAEQDRANFQRLTAAAVLIVPIFPAAGFRHAIVVDTARKPRNWPVSLAPRMRLLGEIMVNALQRSRHAAELARTVEKPKSLKERPESENLYLRDAVAPQVVPEGIVATGPAMAGAVELAHRVAPTSSAVLLLGRLLVAVNCAALPASLVESELFGAPPHPPGP